MFASRAQWSRSRCPVERVDVFITSDDVIYCKGNEVTADELLLILRSERPHARSVVVYADLDCTHGKVVLVEDICRRVGFEQISVATRPLKNVK
ncbi:MAG: biopolymer transporter ExbD [Planctomycetota bacterium]|nr:biopolymer transporter ExbD [Planctomycetota bacterium]